MKRSLATWGPRLAGAVFLIAAASKVRSPCPAVDMLVGLGTPHAAAIVPIASGVEAGVGLALLLRPGRAGVRRAGLGLTVALIGILVLGILRQGLQFRCACLPGLGDWGPLHSLALDVVLALLLVWRPPPPAPGS